MDVQAVALHPHGPLAAAETLDLPAVGAEVAARRRSAEAMKSSGACPVAMRSRITSPDPVGRGNDRRGGTGAASRPIIRAVARRTAEAGTVRPQASIVARYVVSTRSATNG
ncbi:hypothetical protein [Streptomyces bobili]|uniref:hypothetical protein n=1 Tax=Streptomyces bobili TaxID=67280 RepID=UPI003F608DBC